ncbi:hypothetical protein BAnh1_11220 [Bartonella australis AUST/NH1]|uniref:Uncharacterized protein n=1 Tax=Bartonella australis (strain Aust/NH1) TaxID=1094489 RepID=M1P585_BARAA|nr:hypothetical protein [Bartonella australis]AGF74990.1 hypothetical protein BAnh1_11220 [Bartonella australis AUST/NH1]
MNSKYFLLYIFIFSLASTPPSFSHANTRTSAPVVFVLSTPETDSHLSKKGDTFLPTVPSPAGPKSDAFYDSFDIIDAVADIIIKKALFHSFHYFYPLL